MEANKLFSKDIFQHLGDIADDKTVLQMIYLNKKTYGDDYIKRILESRYPYLLQYKDPRESYRHFYVKNIYYIAKIREEFNVIYNKDYSHITPQNFYKILEAYDTFMKLPTPLENNNFELFFPDEYTYQIIFGDRNYLGELVDPFGKSIDPLIMTENEILPSILKHLKKYTPFAVSLVFETRPFSYQRLENQ